MRSKTLLALGAAFIAIVTGPLLAQERPGPTKLVPHKIAANVYWVEGGRSNTGFIVGASGVVVIDAQTSDEAAHVAVAEIAKITPKPVKTVIMKTVKVYSKMKYIFRKFTPIAPLRGRLVLL